MSEDDFSTLTTIYCISGIWEAALSLNWKHRAALCRYHRRSPWFESDCFGFQLPGSIDSQRMFSKIISESLEAQPFMVTICQETDSLFFKNKNKKKRSRAGWFTCRGESRQSSSFTIGVCLLVVGTSYVITLHLKNTEWYKKKKRKPLSDNHTEIRRNSLLILFKQQISGQWRNDLQFKVSSKRSLTSAAYNKVCVII